MVQSGFHLYLDPVGWLACHAPMASVNIAWVLPLAMATWEEASHSPDLTEDVLLVDAIMAADLSEGSMHPDPTYLLLKKRRETVYSPRLIYTQHLFSTRNCS